MLLPIVRPAPGNWERAGSLSAVLRSKVCGPQRRDGGLMSDWGPGRLAARANSDQVAMILSRKKTTPPNATPPAPTAATISLAPR
jgi:hypothetical protein